MNKCLLAIGCALSLMCVPCVHADTAPPSKPKWMASPVKEMVDKARVATGGVAWAKAGYPVQTSITDEEIVLMPAK